MTYSAQSHYRVGRVAGQRVHCTVAPPAILTYDMFDPAIPTRDEKSVESVKQQLQRGMSVDSEVSV